MSHSASYRHHAVVARRNSLALSGHEQVVEPEDSILWSRAQAGDADAFGLFFERHARTIYNYCFRRIGDWAVAEDLVSVVFLEAWRRRDKRLAPGKELPWFLGIATNVLRNRRRSERRYAAALRRVPTPEPDAGFMDESEERLDDERLMRRTLELLSRLPRRELDVFVLCAWFDLSYEDAALALGIPMGTVRSRLSRARARLRELGGAFGHGQNATQLIKETLEP
jgi:RNA polymerase sigma factor (sigma-70 family)